jgi:hypothetical protein
VPAVAGVSNFSDFVSKMHNAYYSNDYIEFIEPIITIAVARLIIKKTAAKASFNRLSIFRNLSSDSIFLSIEILLFIAASSYFF